MYRVFCTDLLTGRKLVHELPIAVDSYEHGLGRPATLTGTVSLDAEADPLPYLVPRRTVLWLHDGGPAPAVGAILWQADPDIEARTLKLSAAGPTSYLDRREIRRTLDFRQVDQLDIARSIVRYVQSTPAGNIRLAVDELLSGVPRDRTYPGDEFKRAGEALRQLSEVDDGFDYRETFTYDPVTGAPGWGLLFGYPQLGRARGNIVFTFDADGGPGVNVTSYTWPRDGAGAANSVVAIGAGEGSAMLRAVAVDDADLAAGFPQLDASHLYKDVTETATLAGHAVEDLRVSSADRVVPTVTVAGPDAPALAGYEPGDFCRFRFSSAFHRRPAPGVPGWDGWLRVVSRKVQPAHAGQDLAVTLTLAPAPIQGVDW